ncbi:VP5 [Kummerowia striata gokushovirus]|nr:VP5 [Kummerowia striata gokushovirus]
MSRSSSPTWVKRSVHASTSQGTSIPLSGDTLLTSRSTKSDFTTMLQALSAPPPRRTWAWSPASFPSNPLSRWLRRKR